MKKITPCRELRNKLLRVMVKDPFRDALDAAWWFAGWYPGVQRPGSVVVACCETCRRRGRYQLRQSSSGVVHPVDLACVEMTAFAEVRTPTGRSGKILRLAAGQCGRCGTIMWAARRIR